MATGILQFHLILEQMCADCTFLEWRLFKMRWFCFTGYMMSWDPHGEDRANAMQLALSQHGLDSLVRDSVVDVWRANRARHEPDELFDDAFTLSMLSSKNLANRLFSSINGDAAWRESGITATREFTALIIRMGEVDVRLVKTPHTAGRRPNFVADFDWTSSEARLSAATRNHDSYSPPVRRPEMTPLFEINSPRASDAVLDCRDAFLLWGADLSSGLTAGWLGIPTTTQDRWLAVVPVWWDEPAPRSAKESTEEEGGRAATFESRPAPIPTIKLKPRRAEGNVL
ncbi:hypothetical protein [Leucobacter sp. W1038]|uniref:hypothetical protein n=1 Tax=Leucobacter sp. W1038 TaxID=3438281 RepID=UPI003D958855